MGSGNAVGSDGSCVVITHGRNPSSNTPWAMTEAKLAKGQSALGSR
jgi:hypothetical protein